MYQKISILLFIIFAINLNAKDFILSYFDSKEQIKDIQTVLDKKFIETSSKKSFGSKKYIWLKASIYNNSNNFNKKYLSISDIQILEDVHFYTVLDKKIVKKETSFNKYTNNDVSYRIGNHLIYENLIPPNSKIDVYIYATAKSNIYFQINVGSFTDVVSKISMSKTILILLTGALCALGLYYLFLYLFTPNPSYLYYTLFVFSTVLWGFYIYGGYVHYFGIFNAGKYSNALILLIPMFIILFFKSIYIKVEGFKVYNSILNILLYLLIISFIVYILVQLEVLPYISIAKFGTILYLFVFIIILLVAITIYFKKLPNSGIFLLSFSANFIGSIISILFFTGKLPYNDFTFHGNMIGGVIEAILFSILLTYMLREVYIQKEEAINNTKIKDVRLGIMGETIDFIAHQWRQPLSQINSSVTQIDTIAYKNSLKLSDLDKELVQIENLTKYMSSTIDDFRNLFTVTKEEVFELNKMIPTTTTIIRKTLEKSNIHLEFTCNETLFIKANKGDISQVLLVMINNAKDVLVQRKIALAKIEIVLFSKEEKIYLQIKDNAGGISNEYKEKIFDAYYSTKEKEKASGLGLYIAKIIIETKMKGSLFVKNDENGACFCIELNKNV